MTIKEIIFENELIIKSLNDMFYGKISGSQQLYLNILTARLQHINESLLEYEEKTEELMNLLYLLP